MPYSEAVKLGILYQLLFLLCDYLIIAELQSFCCVLKILYLFDCVSRSDLVWVKTKLGWGFLKLIIRVFFPRNCATLACRLCLVLQLSAIPVYGLFKVSQLRYTHFNGAVSVKKQTPVTKSVVRHRSLCYLLELS